jgi:purine nucleosidase
MTDPHASSTAVVLVDTDIGSDLDDALALSYLLARPDCEIAGITTVTGEPDVRAQLATVLCRHVGRVVPVVPGAASPLVGTQLQPEAPQARRVLARWAAGDVLREVGAAEFIGRTVRSAPGRVEFLAIGPLTNLAEAFQLDPGLPSLLRGMTVMGGSFGLQPGRPAVEWNMRLDPVAAEAVLAAGVRSVRLIGLDVTHRVALTAAELETLCSTAPTLAPLPDFASDFFSRYREVYLHDPLAAASIFEPHLFRFEGGHVTVQSGGDDAGRTRWETAADGAHELITGMDDSAVRAHILGTLGRNIVPDPLGQRVPGMAGAADG